MKRQLSLVTWGRWSVSTCNPPMRGGSGYELSVFILRNPKGQMGAALRQGGAKFQYGFGHGRIFATKHEADQWALDHGYLRHYYTSPELRKRNVARGAQRRAETEKARLLRVSRYRELLHELS